MDSSKPGGLRGESSGRMEVTDKCSNTGGIVGIESQWGRSPFCWNGGIGFRVKEEAPDLDTSGFLPTAEDDRVILGKNSDECFFKEDVAVVVTQFANAHQVVI